MKLWLMSQSVNNDWDTYDSAVVAAETEEHALSFHPGGYPVEWGGEYSSWALAPEQVKVELVGEAAQGVEAGVICASFNAG